MPSADGRPAGAVARSAIVCVGNRDRGDDAVGCIIGDELRQAGVPNVFDAGVAPENVIQPLVRLGPSRLLFVDACDLRTTPGSHILLDDADFDSLAGSFLSTHTLPLSLTVSLLRLELPGASIALMGVQPALLVLGAALSEPLADALPGLVAACRRWAASADGGVPE